MRRWHLTEKRGRAGRHVRVGNPMDGSGFAACIAALPLHEQSGNSDVHDTTFGKRCDHSPTRACCQEAGNRSERRALVSDRLHGLQPGAMAEPRGGRRLACPSLVQSRRAIPASGETGQGGGGATWRAREPPAAAAALGLAARRFPGHPALTNASVFFGERRKGHRAGPAVGDGAPPPPRQRSVCPWSLSP